MNRGESTHYYLFTFGVHQKGRCIRGLKAHAVGLASALSGEDDPPGIKIFPVEIPCLDAQPFSDLPSWSPPEDLLVSRIMDPIRKPAMAEAAYREGLPALNRDLEDEGKLLNLLEVDRNQFAEDVWSRLKELQSHAPPAEAPREWEIIVGAMRNGIGDVLVNPSQFFGLITPLHLALTEFLDAAYPAATEAEP